MDHVTTELPNATPETTSTWRDAIGRSWEVECLPQRVVFRNLDQTIAIPSADWAKDIYVASHGPTFIIRVDTMAASFGFLVPVDDALFFLRHIGRLETRTPVAPSIEVEQPAAATALFWPRISPLAVWALITSSLAFVPVIGLLPALCAVILLIFHRKRVRRASAWRHSRALCFAACCFLAAGVLVNGVATVGFLVNSGFMEELASAPHGDLPIAAGPTASAPESVVVPQEEPYEQPAPESMDDVPFWQRGHNWPLITACLFVVLFSLCVHEASHATVAWWLGDDFPLREGRVTLNPVAHVDPIGTVLLPLILFLNNASVFGWAKPVPTHTHYLPNPRRADMLIALAGPGSNLLIAFASLLLLLGFATAVSLTIPDARVMNLIGNFSLIEAKGFPMARAFAAVASILKLSFLINVFLAFFNLIPLPPLDGSWVLGHLFPRTFGRLFDAVRPFSLLIFLALIYSKVLVYLIFPAFLVLIPGTLLLSFCTGF